MRPSRFQSLGAVAATFFIIAEANPLPQSPAENILKKRILPPRYNKPYCRVFSGWDSSNSEGGNSPNSVLISSGTYALTSNMEVVSDGDCANRCTAKRVDPVAKQCNYYNVYQTGTDNIYRCVYYTADPLQAPGTFTSRNPGFNGASNSGIFGDTGSDKIASSGYVLVPTVKANDPRYKPQWLYECLGSGIFDDTTMATDGTRHGQQIYIGSQSKDFVQSSVGSPQQNAQYCITKCDAYNTAQSVGGVPFRYCNYVLFYNIYDTISTYTSKNANTGNWPSKFHCSFYSANPQVYPNPPYTPTINPGVSWGDPHPSKWNADAIAYKRVSMDDLDQDPSLTISDVTWRGGRRGALYSPGSANTYPYENSNAEF
ncbi:hypothetical protein ABW21_db0209807 [Orbilia brochopaga]|nr:hypothetical protein ABW21_db0209807 [Drechslerella brochopaga]